MTGKARARGKGSKSNAKSTPTKKLVSALHGQTEAKPLPSIEWLAEMALQILAEQQQEYREPGNRHKREGLAFVFGHRAAREGEVSAALSQALDVYQAAHRQLEALTPPPLPAGLTKGEINNGSVTFTRACKLVTGQTRRDRAREKFLEWIKSTTDEGEDCDWPLQVERSFRVDELGVMKKSFENFLKKSVDRLSGQKTPKGRQSSRKSGQRRGR